jgi:hypothetical protein
MEDKRKVELLGEVIGITYGIYDRIGCYDLIYWDLDSKKLSKEDKEYLRDLEKSITRK